jgi:lipopolysaccharide biosynthesis glycosyltransferase
VPASDPVTKLHVACAAEGEYVIHSAAMLHSMLACHPPGSVAIHYLHGPELAEQTRDRLRDMVERSRGEVRFWEIPDRWVAGLPTKGFTRKATWYRTFLPDLLPDVSRVLYLDADVLVLESVAPLWEVDMASKLVAAVTNVLEPQAIDRPKALGIAHSQGYFNAGVMVLNLDLMRREESSRAVCEYARAHADELAWRDQDAFNVVLGAGRVPLHPRWNCMNALLIFPWSVDVLGREAVAEALESPAIRHFEGPGPYKPWHYMCRREWRDLYRRHRQETPWPRVRLQGRNPRNMWRRLRGRVKGTGGEFIDAPSLADR